MARGFMFDTSFTWNLDALVGPGSPNKVDDVQLVQLGYVCLGLNPKSPASPALRALCAKVVPGASYTGKSDDPLTIVIKAHQAARGGTQDGVVSVIRNTAGKYDAKNTWIMIGLNVNIFNIMENDWPRLERHPKCPPALAAMSRKTFL